MWLAGAGLVLSLAACSAGSHDGLVPNNSDDLSRFALHVDPQSFLDGASAAEIGLVPADSADRWLLRLNVCASGAQGLTALCCELDYDPELYSPVGVEPTDALGPADDVLRLAVLSERGKVHYGQIVARPQEHAGLSGDAVLAVATFRREPAPPARMASTPPTGEASRPVLFVEDSNTLVWYHSSFGDYNQNGEVEIADITPIALHFGEQGPWPISSALFVVDGDQNGEINMGDLMILSLHFREDVGGGYALYSCQDLVDYPADAAADNGTAALEDNQTMADALGDPAVDRLSFRYEVDPMANRFYWVRPEDSIGVVEGWPSLAVAVGAPRMVILVLTNPPAEGSGTQADPYIADVDTDYVFALIDNEYGDVSTDEKTSYQVTEGAGVIEPLLPTLNIEDSFSGVLKVTAIYDGIPNRADTNVYMLVPPPV